MNILGVKIDNLSRPEILGRVEIFLRGENPGTIQGKVLGKFHQIATVNPEFILAAQKDEEFKKVLNDTDLNVADGAGLNLAFWKKGKKLKARIAGTDLMEEILKLAAKDNHGIFLVANSGGLSAWQETRDAILQKYPNLEIGGINLDKNNPNYEIRITNYEIVFCAFGAPDQEKFLHSLKSQENAKIRLVMGVGGSFDYLTGKIKRAPKIMRNLGLEWLWRLIQEPQYRCKRIWNAVIIFPIKITLNK